MNNNCMKSNQMLGFSLIELMVVVAIVALLAAVAVPAYKGYLAQAKVTEIFSIAAGHMKQYEYYRDVGDNRDFCLNSAFGKYIANVDLNAGPYGSSCGAQGNNPNTLGILLNANAADIDPSMANLRMRFSYYLINTNVGGTTPDAVVRWYCYFVRQGGTCSDATNTNIKNILSAGNCVCI